MDIRTAMDPYYCIISTRHEAVADLCVLEARCDGSARAAARKVADHWTDVEMVAVYQGERPVGLLEYAGSAGALARAA